MGGTKVERGYELNEDHVEWLREMAAKFDLPDEGKALRCVLDFAMTEADADAIFGEIRCNHC
jgi:hypothetical protein